MSRGAFALFVSVGSVVALAQQPGSPKPGDSGPARPPTAFNVTGQVMAAADGAVLRRARVHVVATGRQFAAVFTDNDGRFAIEASGGGPFIVTVGKGGYAYARTTLSRADASVPLTVRLSRGAAIAGRVVDQNGAPAAGSVMTARSLDDAVEGVPRFFTTSTDDLGEYRFGGLPPGGYVVAADRPAATLPDVGAIAAFVGVSLATNESARTINDRLFGATVIESGPPSRPPEALVVSGGIRLVRPPEPPGQGVTVQAGEDAGGVDFMVMAADLRTDLERTLAAAGVTLDAIENRPAVAGAAGAIRGRVTTDAGEPIRGAEIQITPFPAPRAMSDADGRYEIRGLRAGNYTLQVSRAGFATIAHGQQRANQAGRTVPVGSDQIVDGIDFILPRGASLSGIVADEHGEPLQDALVQALQLRHVNGRLVAAPASLPRRTDDRGRYRVFGLLPGAYVLVTSVEATRAGSGREERPGYAPVFYPGTPVIDAATPIEVNGDVAALNVAFAPSGAARLRGVARDGDAPLVGGAARLVVTRRSGAILLELPAAPLGADGAFTFSNVPPGEYAVQVRGDGPGRTGLFGVEYVTVSDASPPPVVVRASRGATLEGRFVIEGQLDPDPCAARTGGAGVSVPCPVRFQAAAFSVAPVALDPDRARPQANTTVATSSDDTFYAPGLFGSTAFVLRQAPSEEWYLKSVTIDGVDVTDQAFDFGVGPRTIADAEIVVSRNGATVSGRVTGRPPSPADARPGVIEAGDVPVNDYAVVLFPVFRDQWLPHSRRLRFTVPSRDGAFRLAGLPPGDYFVAAVDRLDGTPAAGEWQDADVLNRLAADAERITLREGESRETTLRLVRR